MTRKLIILLGLVVGWVSLHGQSIESLRKDIERDRKEQEDGTIRRVYEAETHPQHHLGTSQCYSQTRLAN